MIIPQFWALLAAAAFATGGLGVVPDFSGGEVTSVEECRSDLPRHETSLGEVLDSVGLQRAAEQLWTPETDLVIATVWYDSLGAIGDPTIYSETLPDPAVERLAAALRENARETSNPGQTVNLFIGDQDGARVRRVKGFKRCRPEVLDKGGISRKLEQMGQAMGLSRTTSATLRAYVDSDGTVGDVLVTKSSGTVAWDMATHQLLQTTEWRPAMVEGFGVGVWAQLPLTYSPRDP